MFVEYIDNENYLNESCLYGIILQEYFDLSSNRTELSRVEYPKYGYYIKVERVKYTGDSKHFEMRTAYTIDGDKYIGDEKTAKYLCKKKYLTKLQPRLGGPGKICSIGFNEQEQKWYGWSHRAIFGFGVGDKIFEENYGDDKTVFSNHGSKTIRTLDDAKKSASNFAGYVS